MGWITNTKAIAEFLQRSSTRRADFLMISDSNAIFGGHGQDHGITKALSTRRKLYRTPLFSLNENLGVGSSQGYMCAVVNDGARVQTNPIVNPPEYNRLLPYTTGALGALFPANYWAQVSGQTANGNNGMYVTNGGPWDVNANLKYSLSYGTFKASAGVGKIRPVIRRGSAPYTVLIDNGNINPSAVNQEGIVDLDLSLAAGIRNYPIDGRFISAGTIGEGPFFATWQFISWPNIRAGLSYNTTGYYGGVGLRTFILRESVAPQAGWDEYFRQLARAQETTQPVCCFMISSGLNDRNDTAPSIGPVGGIPSDTALGFADNLRGLLNFLQDKWEFAGFDRRNLYFAMIGSHPVSLPDDSDLVAYREQSAIIAGEYLNMSAIDMAEYNVQLQANAVAWYANSVTDRNHMSQTGYEQFYNLVVSGITHEALGVGIPNPKSIAFKAWKEDKYREVRDYCVIRDRPTTYYFSATGNDAADGLTPATAKQTVSEASIVIAASSGSIQILFKRGDEWNVETSLEVSKPFVEIGAYGTGNAPWFNRFAQKYTASGWTLAAGTRYTRAEAIDTSWLRYQGWDDSKSTVVGKVLSRQASAVDCQATSNSFFWDAGVLHVNLGAINPNTVNLEGNANATNVIGVMVSADGGYVHDIRVDGFGQSTDEPDSDTSYQIAWMQGSNERGYAYNCETYYGSSVVHGQIQGYSGAITLIESCSAGFALQGAGSESIFVTKSVEGLQQTFFVNNTIVAGTLPSGTLPWVRRGLPFTSSTTSDTTGLLIADGNTILGSNFSCDRLTYFENTPAADTLDKVRAFIIGEVANGAFLTTFPYKNIAWINCNYTITPQPLPGDTMWEGTSIEEYFSGWMWNTTVELSFAGQVSPATKSFYNALTSNNNCRLWHNRIYIILSSVLTARIDFNTALSDSSPNCEFFNNIYLASVASRLSVGLNNTSDNLKNNAYFNIVGGADLVTRTAYGNDAGKVQLTSLAAANDRRNIEQRGYTGLGLEYDANWDLRPSAECLEIAPTIGPVELGFQQATNYTGTLTEEPTRRRTCVVV